MHPEKGDASTERGPEGTAPTVADDAHGMGMQVVAAPPSAPVRGRGRSRSATVAPPSRPSAAEAFAALSTPLAPPKLRPSSIDPSQHAYGYVTGQTARAATWPRLLELFSKPTWGTRTAIWVWTPTSNGLVPAFHVPELVDAMAQGMRGKVRRNAWLAVNAAIAILVLWLAWGRAHPEAFRLLWSLAVLFVGGSAVSAVATSLTLRSSARAALAGPSLQDVLARVFRGRPARTSQVLAVVWFVVWFLSLVLVGRHVAQAAGLLKEGPGREQYLRWLTCSFLHLHYMHVAFNAGALCVWGPLVEALTTRGTLGIVFLASVVGGSFASWSLLAAPSVGASGGLCGLLGFLVVLCVRWRARLPVGLGHMLASSVVALLAIGTLLVDMIDNAAHAGGFVVGAILGLVLAPPEPVAQAPVGPIRKAAGLMAWLVLAGAAVGTVVALARYRP